MTYSPHPYVVRLLAYQRASNDHNIEACVDMFTEDGAIESGGEVYTGASALRDAHEYDLGSHTLVEFRDFEINDDMVKCTFWNEHELSRAIGNGGMTGKAVFTFHGDQIQKFQIMPPEESERKRVMELAGPAIKWLREIHPEAVAKWNGFDRAAGEAVFALAGLWRAHLESGSETRR